MQLLRGSHRDAPRTDAERNPVDVGEDNTFTMPGKAVTVTAEFEPAPTEVDLDLETQTAAPDHKDITQKYKKTTTETTTAYHKIALTWTNQTLNISNGAEYVWNPATLDWVASSGSIPSVLGESNVSTFTFYNYSTVPFNGGVEKFEVETALQDTYTGVSIGSDITLNAVMCNEDGSARKDLYYTDGQVDPEKLPKGTVTATLNVDASKFPSEVMPSAAKYGTFTVKFTRWQSANA